MEYATNSTGTPYDTSTPIPKLFIQIQKELQIFNAANPLFTNVQIIAKLCILVKNWTLQWNVQGLGSSSSSRKYLAELTHTILSIIKYVSNY